MRRYIRRPSAALVVACIALLVALGGTSVAAVSQLARSSVGTPQLKDNAVTAKKLRNNAVTNPKIANNAVTASKVRNGSLLAADFADVALDQARALAVERGVEVEWVEVDLREWEPPARAFDLVVMLYLQLPPDELGPIVRRAAGSVAEGGTMLVVGHHSDNLASGVGGPKDPRVLFTPEDVAAELGGLEVEKAEAVIRPVEGEGDAIDALVRARRG